MNCCRAGRDGSRDRADVGHDDHRRAALEGFRQARANLGILRHDDVGERFDGLADVIERRQERLGLIGLAAGQQRHTLALEIVIQNKGRCGEALAFDGDGLDVVAQFKRRFEFGVAGLARGGKLRFANAAALAVEGGDGDRGGRAVAGDFDIQRVSGVGHSRNGGERRWIGREPEEAGEAGAFERFECCLVAGLVDAIRQEGERGAGLAAEDALSARPVTFRVPAATGCGAMAARTLRAVDGSNGPVSAVAVADVAAM